MSEDTTRIYMEYLWSKESKKNVQLEFNFTCMAGGIAEAYYWKTTGELPIPKKLYRFAMEKLPADMKAVYYKFRDTYNLPNYES